MADYFLDLPSSPDPLADEVPSSARPATRRITKSQHDLPSFSIPQSSPRRGSRAQSPRKRTFQLDVGDERSPQRIRVTVEAEEALKRSAVNRKLFPSPSPTRSAHRRETITTTTTTVPLNDEAGLLEGEDSTPRKRGRPRRTSNGTPMPRVRKRAGTPLQRKAKQARYESEPPSEASVVSDAPMGMVVDGDEETPKPKTRTRKTPKKSAAFPAVPSSQLSTKTTGRKRGRPRKVAIPEEAAVLAGARAETSAVSSNVSTSKSNVHHDNEQQSDRLKEIARDMVLDENIDDHGNTISEFSPPSRENSGTPAQLHDHHQMPESIERFSNSPTSSHQELALNDDDPIMSEDYLAMEPQSDLQSEDGEDRMTYNRQDTLANASDFSMIAVESLPSFQASFQASFHADVDEPKSGPHEMGEETSQIINQTLETLRRNLQTKPNSPLHGEPDEDELTRDEGRSEMLRNSTVATGNNGRRALSSSPRRLKTLPLSRQVFVGRGHVDDSFSSIPDSILHAATPRRLPMKTTSAEYHDEDNGAYDDSFSEIPEVVLKAATPKPPGQLGMPSRRSPTRNEELHQSSRSVAQRSSADYGSSRLPTPEETSSSNDGSKKTRENDTGVSLRSRDNSDSIHHTDVPSSPPVMTRPRALDFGSSGLQHELDGTQEQRSSSSHLHPSAITTSNPLQSLEAPIPSARPSLSPIVRVGRTLQNVMSDRSSPEGRESSLGSPFRRSASSDHPRQSSVARSPSPSIRNREMQNESQPSPDTPTPLDRSARSNPSRNFRRISQNSNWVEDPFALDKIRHPTTKLLEESASHRPSEPGSTRVGPPSDDEMSWAARGGSPLQISHQPSLLQSANSEDQSIATIHDVSLHSGQDKEDQGDKLVQNANEDDSDGHEDGNGDDFDIWDIEASRPSPRRPEPIQSVPQSDVPQPRRSKIPSPWRRPNRRLIYQDEIASSSQIEIEESSQSEVEQYPSTRSRHRPSASQSQPNVPREDPVPVQERLGHIATSGEKSHVSPLTSHEDFEGYAGFPDAEETDESARNKEQEHLEQSEEPEEPNGPEEVEAEEETEELKEPEIPVVSGARADVSEYSMVAQQARPTPKAHEKPTSSKSRFFGGFDILSFFSSPATLPTKKAPEAKPSESVNNPTISQPAFETQPPKEPLRTLRSTGLFPPIPQKEFRPSPVRGTSLFSPGPTLQSNGTVADTYEPSTSVSPSVSRSPPGSATPSTPERQDFPPIQQKRNFTPRPGQPNGSLFGPSQTSSSPSQDEGDDGYLREASDEQDSSGLTEGSEYERVPPREKPSQWNRNLSPTKSSFRSPLKPTTPGRVVAFTNHTSSPLAEAQARNSLRNSDNARNIISQGPLLRPTFEGKENQPHHTIYHLKSTTANNTLDKANPKASTVLQASRPRATTLVAPTLSPTTWSKQHWIRLDAILQLRRRDPLRFQQQCALPPRDKRRSAALLGKEVSAQGARLVLEAWHLEVIEAFKLEVGGWDERALAKRIFALMAGEEKRRREAVAAR
ncbi:hypothetical protein F5Y19DRAFT_461823 [Xylariaceae sp. FL1651]|nr:hypothetical protein F5Y19DRAFT_461823 [Xylariaceae sp. FL1651]